MRELALVVDKLFPHRLVVAELMPQLRQPRRLDPAFAHAHRDGVAGDEVDQHEAEKGDADESRDDQRNPAEEKSDHFLLPAP